MAARQRRFEIRVFLPLDESPSQAVESHLPGAAGCTAPEPWARARGPKELSLVLLLYQAGSLAEGPVEPPRKRNGSPLGTTHNNAQLKHYNNIRIILYYNIKNKFIIIILNIVM